MSTSEILRAHLPCPDCGSSDALSEYTDGHTYCYSCNALHNSDETEPTTKYDDFISDLSLKPLKARGITESTCRKYQYYFTNYKGKPCQVANYFDENGTLVGQKLRFQDKSFAVKGKLSTTFFGQQLYNNGVRLIITEGEIDCLTVSQLLGNQEPVVSIPCGVQSAKKVFEANLKWLEAFKEVVVVFDNDDAGRKGAKEIEGILSPEKLRIAVLKQYKDPNEYYINNKGNELLEALENAKKVTPENIINADTLLDDLLEEPEEVTGYSLPWTVKANKMIRGVRKGEITMLTAGTGIGKSTMIRELGYHLVMDHGLKIGSMMLEENVLRTSKGYIGLYLNKPVHLSRKGITNDQYTEAFNHTLGTGKFVMYNHFGSLDNSSILNAIRYMAVTEKCDFILIDHISIAVSGIESNNERKLIDILMTRLRQLCEELGVGLICICHLKRGDGKKSAEEGGSISLEDLRGSQAIAQLSDTIIALERNQQADSDIKKNLVQIRVLKCRQTGDTGIGGKLWFNKERNRLEIPNADLMNDIESDNEVAEF
jgi:twinkle protein|nr:MAG TPA: DNA directed DNA polymerase [Caudoviricetes sp.]